MKAVPRLREVFEWMHEGAWDHASTEVLEHVAEMSEEFGPALTQLGQVAREKLAQRGAGMPDKETAAERRDRHEREFVEYVDDSIGTDPFEREEALDGFVGTTGVPASSTYYGDVAAMANATFERVRRDRVNGFRRYTWIGPDGGASDTRYMLASAAPLPVRTAVHEHGLATLLGVAQYVADTARWRAQAMADLSPIAQKTLRDAELAQLHRALDELFAD